LDAPRAIRLNIQIGGDSPGRAVFIGAVEFVREGCRTLHPGIEHDRLSNVVVKHGALDVLAAHVNAVASMKENGG
jgi:hypothetical protein